MIEEEESKRRKDGRKAGGLAANEGEVQNERTAKAKEAASIVRIKELQPGLVRRRYLEA